MTGRAVRHPKHYRPCFYRVWKVIGVKEKDGVITIGLQNPYHKEEITSASFPSNQAFTNTYGVEEPLKRAGIELGNYIALDLNALEIDHEL